MKRRSLAFAAAALTAALSGGAALGARQPIALPDFELTGLDGEPIGSRSGLPSTGKWLIVVVQPNCRPCDTLLRVVKQEEHPQLPPRMVIIAGNTDGAGVTRMRDTLTDLAGAHWYADPSRKASISLKVSGVPMVFGVRNTTIEWSLSGGLPSDAQVKSILASWAAE